MGSAVRTDIARAALRNHQRRNRTARRLGRGCRTDRGRRRASNAAHSRRFTHCAAVSKCDKAGAPRGFSYREVHCLSGSEKRNEGTEIQKLWNKAMSKMRNAMRPLLLMLLLCLVGGCETTRSTGTTYDSAKQEMANAARARQSAKQSEDVDKALLPPLTVEMPKVDGRPIEPRFDLAVNNAPAGQVFMAIVSGTRYSMVVHPGVKEPLSVNLRDVTVFEALDTIREVYGYEYKLQGNRILIEPLSLQTRVYQVNYLMSQRKGKTEVRVT